MVVPASHEVRPASTSESGATPMSGGHEPAPDTKQPTRAVPAVAAAATPVEPASSLVAAPVGGVWHLNALQSLKIGPLPVSAPSAAFLPHADARRLGAADASVTPHVPDVNAAMTLAGTTSPAFLMPAFGQFPVQAGTAAEGEGGKVLSPLKVNVALRPKPIETSDASPVPPAVVKDLHFDPMYQITETWPFETSSNVYAMLLHPSQQLDLSYHQQVLAAKGLVSPLMHLQQQQEQPLLLRHPGLPLQTSPIGTRMQPFYPQQTLGTSSPHQIAAPYLSSGLPSPFSPAAGLSAISLSDIMMVGDPGLFLPPNSPTNILKHLLPPIAPQHLGLNVKDISLNELRPHFNKPMAVVAKELGVCITLMKKICRRNGLVRWPHRRIRSLVNRITSLQVIAGNASDAEQKRFHSQIAALREELSTVIQNPNEKSRKAQADAKARSPCLRSCADEAGEGDDDGHAEGDDDDDEEMLVAEDDDDKFLGAADSLSLAAPAPSSCPVGAPLNSSPDRSAFLKVAHKDGAGRDRDTKLAAVCENGDLGVYSKKRKEFVSQNMPPPPIKIPCHRVQQRTCCHDSSTLEPPIRTETGDRVDGGSAGGEDAPDRDLERPSSTTSTSSKRGSISSILCDPNE